MKYVFAAAALIISPVVAFAQTAPALTPAANLPAGTYGLDKTHASLTWKVSHLGLSNYTARFTRLDATLTIDPKDPTKAKLVATVDPASVRTDFVGAEDFDGVLAKNEQWFNAGKYTEIKYESTRIEKTGENTAKIHGNLTFMGVTKPLTLDAKYNGGYAEKPFAKSGKVAALGFSATGVVKRSDWGMGAFVPVVGDDVTLMIETEFEQQIPAAK